MSGPIRRIGAFKGMGGELRGGRQSGGKDLPLPSRSLEVFHSTQRMNRIRQSLRPASWADEGQVAIRRYSRRGGSTWNIGTNKILAPKERPANAHMDRSEGAT